MNLDRLEKIVRHAHERHPADFAALLGTEGVGPATVRSLSLSAELIYNAPASHEDLAKAAGCHPAVPREESRKWADYSYAHGGKDGHPFPVDQIAYDRSIQVLTDAVRKSHIGHTEKADAFRRLAKLSY